MSMVHSSEFRPEFLSLIFFLIVFCIVSVIISLFIEQVTLRFRVRDLVRPGLIARVSRRGFKILVFFLVAAIAYGSINSGVLFGTETRVEYLWGIVLVLGGMYGLIFDPEVYMGELQQIRLKGFWAVLVNLGFIVLGIYILSLTLVS